jgi:acyl-CoA reductase-like NAD-dependent aldehyde dehydrogenase
MGFARQTSGKNRDSVTEPTRLGVSSGSAPRHDLVSPVTGEVLERVRLATHEEILAAARRLAESPGSPPPDEIFAFFRRLKAELQARRSEFVRVTIAETGFIARDAEETVEAAIDFLGSFETYAEQQAQPECVFHHSYSSGSQRSMRLTSRPYSLVAALVPQNASLTLGITIIASALYAGSRVLLRPSLQTASTGILLSESVLASDPPEGRIDVVNCHASTFLEASCASEHVEVVHYIGSNRHASAVLSQTFAAGKLCLLDGQGNGILYVDETYPLEAAARLITDAATRFNGETCTSVNGVLVAETMFRHLQAALVESFEALKVGDPFAAGTCVGPLFSENQAQGLGRILSENGSRILAGGESTGAYFRPAVVEGVRLDDPIVFEGLFGPAVWMEPVCWSDVRRWLRANRFPLSDTVLTARPEVIREFARVSRAPRICVNADPSVESMFEPWGGYPPGSLNPVSPWAEKYRQGYQLDGHMEEIASAARSSEPLA